MKSKLMIIGIIVLLILTNVVTSYAAETSVGVLLAVTPSEVKVGESFTVTFNAQCSDGINGISATYSYDEDKLELVSATVGSDFASLGSENEIALISNSTTSITNADVYTFTFKVKEGVEVGSEAKVSIDEIILDSDALENSTHTLDAKEISVTVIAGNEGAGNEGAGSEGAGNEGAGNEGAGNEGAGNEGAGNEGAGNEGAGNEGAGNEGAGNEGAGDNGSDDKEQTTVPGTTVVVGDDKKDDTTVDNKFPKAGLNTMLAFGIVAIIGVAVVLYRKNQKYQDIK